MLDLAGQRPAGEVVGLVTKAVQKSLTTPDRLRSLLESRARQRHRQLIAGMLTEVAAGAESFLEVQYLRTVERPHGLPRGSRQGARRDLRYKRDVRYDEFAVIVELDGRLGHQAEGRFRDMSRDNRHALLDELTLRYGYFDVSSRACAVAYQVYRAIARRGFREPFLRCSVCAGLPEAYLQSA